jgi:hypothetical protein
MHRFMSLMLLMELHMLQPVNKEMLDYMQVKLNVNTKLLVHSFQIYIIHNT